ncbi:MAG: tetratricopeptide repeat protein, partial [Elusimicrobia bacterium]|nr:tetratricopeptide repeat protein [Elusimicrobiota bacterium]
FIKSLFIFFIISGPFFLFISKMPANPHALVIVEASYLVPFFCAFVAGAYFLRKIPEKISVPLLVLICFFLFLKNFSLLNNRENFFARDWAQNVFASTPKGSSVILRKDVQLFCLWYENIAKGKRKDSIFLAQGLMQAPWYKKQIIKQEKCVIPQFVWGEEFFRRFFELNKRVFITAHFEASPEFLKSVNPVPHGVLSAVGQERNFTDVDFFWSDFPSTMYYRDFYKKELSKDYCQAFNSKGIACYSKDKNRALENFLKALAFDPYDAQVLYNIGATYQEKGDLKKAITFYKTGLWALDLEYRDKRSAPFIDRQKAKIFNNIGTIFEKKGKFGKALENYDRAVSLDPDFAQGYYNKGVIYWRLKQWDKVVENFKKCLEIEPENQNARYYLKLLEKKELKNQWQGLRIKD